jgi:Flp pilus assembly protein TadD
LLAANTGNLDSAASSLRKSLELNPKYGRTHFFLAWVLTRQGKLDQARDEYRLALLYGALLSTEDKAAALRAIAGINEKLPPK